MKNILFLDANNTVKDAILYAKKSGYRIITSDNIPSHFCHQLADKSYNISTYDIASLKTIVENEQIDGIVYMTSEHGLYGASRLNELYHLPGITYDMANLFCNKGLFRNFLLKNDFECPSFQLISSIEQIDVSILTFPVIVKPADAGGGNVGVTKVLYREDLFSAVEKALKVPLCHTVLIESFIESSLQINGDCFVYDGELKLMYLGKYLYPNLQSILPFATVFSSDVIPDGILSEVRKMMQRMLCLTKFQSGVLNVEMRVGVDGKIYFIEINPRYSGNCIFRLMNKAYGVNMSEISVRLAIGDSIELPYLNPIGNYAYVLFYALREGVLDRIDISSELKKNIIDYQSFVKRGDHIRRFLTLRDRLALVHLTDESSFRLYEIVSNITDYYKLEMKNGL